MEKPQQKWYLVAVLDTAGALPQVVDVRVTSETAWGLTRHGRRYDYAQLGVMNLPEGEDPSEHAIDYAKMAHPWAVFHLRREVKLSPPYYEGSPHGSVHRESLNNLLSDARDNDLSRPEIIDWLEQVLS